MQSPIFGPSKARACSGTTTPRGCELLELLARAPRVQVLPGPCRQLRRLPTAARIGPSRRRPGLGGQLIGFPRGRRWGGTRPGYWPPRSRRAAACAPVVGFRLCLLRADLFREPLQLRVEAHAGLLAGTGKCVLSLGVGL